MNIAKACIKHKVATLLARGGITYWLCHVAGMESYGCQLVGGSTVFLARILAVKYHICLPILKGSDEVEANENKEQ